MKIGMILDRVFPPDIRVEKEARTLIKAGHEVYLLCMKAPNLPDVDVLDGISLFRCNFYPEHFLGNKIGKLMERITFKNQKLIDQIQKFVDVDSIDVLHVHDLPKVKSALIAGRIKGIPVIADLHENYPEAIQFYTGKKFISRFFRFLNGAKRWKKYENYCLNRVNHVIVVVDEAKERVVNDYEIPAEKVTIVSNTEDVDYFESFNLSHDLINSYKSYFTITYIGSFGPHRGLDVPIKAMTLLKEKIPNIRLLMVGKGNIRGELEKLAAGLGVSQSVEFTGWQPFEFMPSYIALSDVCLVPHHSNPHTDSTIPHKLFQYMLMEKPVVVSTCKPLARIVNETQAGLVFESGNVDDFVRVCLELIDEKKRKQLGENGKQAVLKKYNWSETGKELIRVYDKI